VAPLLIGRGLDLRQQRSAKRLGSAPAAGAIPSGNMRSGSHWPSPSWESWDAPTSCRWLQAWGDYLSMLRRGADAARFLADELDRVVAREEGNDETPPTVA
jgi:hypothetical protein